MNKVNISLQNLGLSDVEVEIYLYLLKSGRKTVSNIRKKFGIGGWILGCFMGLVIGLKLIALSVWRQRPDYEADRAGCYACGRCFEFCPMEHKRRNKKSDLLESASG